MPAWQITAHDKLQKILDFNGKVSSAAALSAKWKIRVTPSVLFFGIKGIEIAVRLQGFSADFCGAYLDGAFDAARQRLKNN